MRLIKSFDDLSNFNNVVVPLSLCIDEVVFVFKRDVDKRDIDNARTIIKKYKNIKIEFKKTNESELTELVKTNDLLDVSTDRSLSFVLHEIGIKNNIDIIYYDKEEQRIKSFTRKKIIADKMFSLSIEDIVTLGGGKIISHLHKPINNQNSINKIYETVDKTSDDYSSFISFVSKINNLAINNRILTKEDVLKITGDQNYQKFKELNLFTIEDNKIVFYNEEIEESFKVSGSFLENYIYHKIKESNYFDDVMMSVTIEFFDGKWRHPVKCELDALILKDNQLLFTSIKSNKVEVDDLNEIKVHNVMFGNNLSKPVICINNDLNIKRPGVYAKAMELGVYVIDETSFIDKTIVKKFVEILNDTYKYERI